MERRKIPAAGTDRQLNLPKHTFLVIAYCLIFRIGITSAQFDSTAYLKADGPVLRNQLGNGELVNLRGTNLGSWLSMEWWIGPLGYGALVADAWTMYAGNGISDAHLEFITDGDPSTVWDSDTIQNGLKDQQVVFSCHNEIVFNKIILNSGVESTGWASHYTVDISSDSLNWETVASGKVDAGEMVHYTDIKAGTYFRIRQTGDSDYSWKIAEFDILLNDDYTVRNAMYDRFGVDQADSLWDYYQSVWITTADLDRIKNTGLNMVRVPFYWMEVMNNDGTMKEYAFNQLDWIVTECKEREIYVILDLHGAPGGLNGYITSGQAYTNEIWHDTISQRMTVDLWKAIAAHYIGEPTIAAFDLLNEPVSNNEQLSVSDMYDRIYDAVREIDTNRILCLQAFWNFDLIDKPGDRGWENVIYQGHYYNTDFDNWESLYGTVRYAISDMSWHQREWDVPVLAGEYNFWMQWDLWSVLMNGFNSCNVSWCNWTYKNNTGTNNWGLYLSNENEQPRPSYDDPDDIKTKWDRFETSFFIRNDRLIDTISNYARDTAYRPTGETVWLKAYNNTYISSEDGQSAMTCNTAVLTEAEEFQIVDAEDGQIALRGSNGKYVTSNGGLYPMTCTKDEIGENEKFYWINLADNTVALQGSGGFVSMENGSIPMNCNRTFIDGWEIFTWGTVSSTSVFHSDQYEVKIYPNPANHSNFLVIETDMAECSIRIVDIYGKTWITNNIISSPNKIDISILLPGFYVVEILSEKGRQSKMLVV